MADLRSVADGSPVVKFDDQQLKFFLNVFRGARDARSSLE